MFTRHTKIRVSSNSAVHFSFIMYVLYSSIEPLKTVHIPHTVT